MPTQVFILEGCNSDLDDHKINGGSSLATMARMAYNMNFSASTGDTSYSGGVMKAGMVMLDSPLEEEETFRPVGRSENYGNYGYIAFWGSEGNHCIVRVDENGTVEIVFQDPILDFEEDGDVDIKEMVNSSEENDIDLYITDNHSEPKIISLNITYPSPIELWMVSQIRRPGALAPFVGFRSIIGIIVPPRYTLNQISDEYDFLFKNPNGTQYSYYYVYRNYQTSRLAPVSNILFNTQETDLDPTLSLYVALPVQEYEGFLDNLEMVREVVFVYRRGNTGTWNVLKRIANDGTQDTPSDQSAFPGGVSGISVGVAIPNTNYFPVDPVSEDIILLQEDAVPRLAAANSIAGNRLEYGNYLLGYPNWSGLSLEVTAVQKTDLDFLDNPDIDDAAQEQLGFRPSGRYQVGVELLDFGGRRIGVVAATDFIVPDYELWHEFIEFDTANVFTEANTYWYRDAANNRYKLEWTLTGALPDWCASYRIVRTKDQIASSFYRTVARIYAWYEKVASDPLSVEGDEGDVFFCQISGNIPNHFVIKDEDGIGPVENYYFRGYAVQLSMGEPIVFNTGSELYVKIIGSADSMNDSTLGGYGQEFLIEKQVGNVFFFKYPNLIGADEPIPDTFKGTYALKDGGTIKPNYSAFFDVEFTFRRTQPDVVFWQTSYGTIKDASDFVSGESGEMEGDVYFTKYRKINQATPTSYLYDVDISNDLSKTSYSGVGEYIHGGALSMNPLDVFNQTAVSTIGQFNIVNETQKETRLETHVLYSDTTIPGSQINGLNRFDSFNNEAMPVEHGPIVALVTTGATQKEPGVLIAIGTIGWESIYVNATQITNADGTISVQPNTQTATNKVLASHRPLLGLFGVSRLRNITKTPFATIYAWSNRVNDVVRYAQNGLELLGRNFGFANILRKELSGNSLVFIVYDQMLDEVIIQGRNRDAFVFSERKKLWQGRVEYNATVDTVLTFPEIGVSFSQGQLYVLAQQFWKTTPDNLTNNFFGEQKAMHVDLVLNENIKSLKRWNKVDIDGPGIAPEIAILSMNVEGETSLAPNKWREDAVSLRYYATFEGNDGGTGGSVRGISMRSRIGYLNIQWPAEQIDKLNLIEISFSLPEIQSKPSA